MMVSIDASMMGAVNDTSRKTQTFGYLSLLVELQIGRLVELCGIAAVLANLLLQLPEGLGTVGAIEQGGATTRSLLLSWSTEEAKQGGYHEE